MKLFDEVDVGFTCAGMWVTNPTNAAGDVAISMPIALFDATGASATSLAGTLRVRSLADPATRFSIGVQSSPTLVGEKLFPINLPVLDQTTSLFGGTLHYGTVSFTLRGLSLPANQNTFLGFDFVPQAGHSLKLFLNDGTVNDASAPNLETTWIHLFVYDEEDGYFLGDLKDTDRFGPNRYLAASYSIVPATDPAGTWIANVSGAWSASANWINGIVPAGVDAHAKFTDAATVSRTITLTTPQTLGHLTFDNPNRYTLSGTGGSLTMNVSTGQATLTAVQGVHAINLPMTLADDLTVNAGPGARIGVAKTLSGPTQTLTKVGAGLLVCEWLDIGTLDIQGGSVGYAGNPSLWVIRNLSIAPGATLDLSAGGSFLVDYTDVSPIDEIQDMFRDGRIMTGEINASVGYGELAEVRASTRPAGDATSILLRATYAGDANLDWAVGFDDLLRLASHYGETGRHWTDGDFDHNGVVNFADLLILASNYGEYANGIVANDWTLAQAELPEPASVLSVLALAFGLRRVRRRAGSCRSDGFPLTA
ncbi:MAG: hypothetical protein QM770_23190 [Tepidisphaeraceae bacterium]